MSRIVNSHRTIEYWLASATVAWGLWLLGAWDTFASTPAFRVVTNIAPEWVWGTMIVIAGASLFVGLCYANVPVRKWSLLLLCLLWLAVWAGLLMGNWRGTSTIVYLHLAVLSALLYLRLKEHGKH